LPTKGKTKDVLFGCVERKAVVKYTTSNLLLALCSGYRTREGRMSKSSVQFGTAQVGIIVLTIATALIHIYLAFQFPERPDPIFFLNGVGYWGLVTLLYLPLAQLDRYRSQIRWALMAYTALTLILWVLIGQGSPLTNTPPNLVAYIDKLIEVALLVLLWSEQQAFAKG
jgi:hypothetical protein